MDNLIVKNNSYDNEGGGELIGKNFYQLQKLLAMLNFSLEEIKFYINVM